MSDRVKNRKLSPASQSEPRVAIDYHKYHSANMFTNDTMKVSTPSPPVSDMEKVKFQAIENASAQTLGTPGHSLVKGALTQGEAE